MLYLKLVPNEFKNENHDIRELVVAKDLGYKIIVVATTKKDKNFREQYNGYDVYRISTRRLGKSAWLYYFNRGIAFINFILITRKVDADIISGHNYVVTLAAYIANCFKKRKAKLIYDSHEFELYSYAPERTEFQRKIVKLVEGFLIRRVDLALMVGDKIADGVQKLYGLEKRPTVVRNTPPYWHLNLEKSVEIRKCFLRKFRFSEKAFLLMYHGGIGPGRGIEYAIDALSSLPEDIGLIVMGYENAPGMVERLKSLAMKKKVLHRIIFHPAVSLEDLKDYVGAVDVELVLIEGKECVSYAYSLPNKFFESIQSCVPMICFDLPEMGKIVNQYDIGLLVKENDAEGVADAVLKLRDDKDLYARLKRNMEKAKEELCWEKESLKLKMEIQKMIGEVRDAM